MRRTKTLYGHTVCKGCWASFFTRRQLAGLIDAIPILFFSLILADVFADVRKPSGLFPNRADWPYYACCSAVLVLRDAFGGRSLGKMICDLQVVDRTSHAPVGLLRSALRNWFLCMPLLALIEDSAMSRGPRIGDAIARTRVIWGRHRDNQVFTGVAGVAKIFE
jgi:uncharacterized RDD family membrane protein YckC